MIQEFALPSIFDAFFNHQMAFNNDEKVRKSKHSQVLGVRGRQLTTSDRQHFIIQVL